jgi:hypothetical protein
MVIFHSYVSLPEGIAPPNIIVGNQVGSKTNSVGDHTKFDARLSFTINRSKTAPFIEYRQPASSLLHDTSYKPFLLQKFIS